MHSVLKKSDLINGVEMHADPLSPLPTALSLARARRVGKPNQAPNKDEVGIENCRFCHPEKLVGQPKLEFSDDRTAAFFPNAAPYLSGDQQVGFLRHDNQELMEKALHITKLEQIRRMDLYFLLKSAVEYAKRFSKKPVMSKESPRTVLGFNFGKLAGQTVPHIHIQYGWDTQVPCETIYEEKLALYYRELSEEQLIVFHSGNDNDVKVIAPWSPKGQYQIDLHYPKYEIRKFDDRDIKVFAHFAWLIIRHYVEKLSIHNINIIFLNSPLQREVVPVVAQFIPRVNTPAIYEMLGVNVVDTPPSDIAANFRGVFCPDELKVAEAYNPKEEWSKSVV